MFTDESVLRLCSVFWYRMLNATWIYKFYLYSPDSTKILFAWLLEWGIQVYIFNNRQCVLITIMRNKYLLKGIFVEGKMFIYSKFENKHFPLYKTFLQFEYTSPLRNKYIQIDKILLQFFFVKFIVTLLSSIESLVVVLLNRKQ